MLPRKTAGALRRLFRVSDRAPSGRLDALDAELMDRFDRLHPETRRGRRITAFTLRRMAAAGAAFALAGILACAPVELEVARGKRLDIAYDAAASGPPDTARLREILTKEGSLEDVELRVRQNGTRVEIRVAVWGIALPDALAERVRTEVPGLAEATITEQPLNERIRGTLGEKLRRTLFDAGVDDSTSARLRAQIVKDLGGSETLFVSDTQDEHGNSRVEFSGQARGVPLVIPRGKTVAVRIPFVIGRGSSSSPAVLGAAPDLATSRLVFTGREVGSATYIVVDAADSSHRMEFNVKVVE